MVEELLPRKAQAIASQQWEQNILSALLLNHLPGYADQGAQIQDYPFTKKH